MPRDVLGVTGLIAGIERLADSRGTIFYCLAVIGEESKGERLQGEKELLTRLRHRRGPSSLSTVDFCRAPWWLILLSLCEQAIMNDSCKLVTWAYSAADPRPYRDSAGLPPPYGDGDPSQWMVKDGATADLVSFFDDVNALNTRERASGICSGERLCSVATNDMVTRVCGPILGYPPLSDLY